ncbi:MAG: RNA polymerase sigma factor FliA [Epsilonproteobacteria bacterium]|nr:RNA polymerase sigma factor FliA [Campylobacterota bacterium]
MLNKDKVVKEYQKSLRADQDNMVLQFMPAVRGMAYRLKERLPSSVAVEDLISIGTEEMIKLSRKYDKDINNSFWGYAKKRVYGSMLDYLRSLDVVSRSSRRLIKSIESEVARYLNEHQEEPSNEYLADLLGESVEKIKEARRASEIASNMPLNEQLAIFEEKSVDEIIEKEQLIEHIRDILATLSEREQMIIQLYYFEELNLKEISSILNISESRISQIHKKLIRTIRERIAGEDDG